MGAITSESLKQHIIEHEILGTKSVALANIFDLNQLVLYTDGRIFTNNEGNIHIFTEPLPKKVEEDF